MRRDLPALHGVPGNAIPGANAITCANQFAFASAFAINARTRAGVCRLLGFTRKTMLRNSGKNKGHARKNDSKQSRRETARGKEFVDESLVKSGSIPGASIDDFTQGGYACHKCDWTTTKQGLGGLRPLRAHSKRHVRDRRSVVNTLIVQTMVLVVSVTFALLPSFIWLVPTTLVGEIRSLNIPADAELIVAVTAITSILLAAAILFTGDSYLETGRRHWASRYAWLIMLLPVLMWVVAGLRWLEVGHDIWWPWLTPVLIPWVVWLLGGYDVALTRLAAQRREFQPKNQRKLLRSKNKFIDYRIGPYRRNLEAQIKDGRIVLVRLSRKRRDFMKRLGLGKVQLDKSREMHRLKKAEEKRFKAEQAARRARERATRKKQARDRRKRRTDDSARGT